MARQRDLLVNFERVRREMDELFGDFGESWFGRRAQSGFMPRVDVYYCGGNLPPSSSGEHRVGDAGGPMAIVKVELPGVSPDSVDLEIAGRELVISGERPVQETEGRVYQQVEIEAGPFRRVVKLNADVVADEARATFEDGVLRIELPLRRAQRLAQRVEIEDREG
jgi:HSP20 family protein